MFKKMCTAVLASFLILALLSGCQKPEKLPEETTAPTETEEESTAAETEEETTTAEESTETVASETPAETETETAAEEPDPRLSALDNYENVFIVTGEEGANVRTQPKTDSDILGMVPYLGGGDVKGREGDWLKVVTCGLDGYLYAPLAVTGEEAKALAVQQVQWACEMTEESVNIRDAASLDSNVIGSAARGQTFRVTGLQGDFFEIDYNGTTAYVSRTVSKDRYILQEAQVYEKTPAAQENAGSAEAESPSAAQSPEQAAPAPQTTQVVEAAMNTGSAPQAVVQGSNGLTVCIDAGHQQHGMSEMEPNGPGSTVMKAKLTTGTAGCATGIPEYQTTLAVALQLQNELAARGYTVVMIRTTNDCPVSNAERAVIANEYGSSCFLRIHCNSVTDPNVTGVISYAPAPGNPYMDAGNVDQSNAFANIVNAKTSEATGAQNRGIIQDNSMTGINWCKVPVSIIEMGFSSNPTEDQLMNDPSYQAKLVQGMANGIDAYFGR